MAKGFNERYRSDIQSVSGGCFKGANAAFTQNNTLVSTAHDILSSQQPFFDGTAHSALQ